MNWRFPLFGGGQSQTQPNLQDDPSQSHHPPSVTSSSRPSTSSDGARLPLLPQSSPTEAAGVIARLKDKSVDELRKLLNDKEAYNAFFNSLDQVKIQNNIRDELRGETLQLAKKNLEKEPMILELRNQCTIIRTTELAPAQERLTELQKKKDEILSSYSPSSLLEKLLESMSKVEEESDMLHEQLIRKEIDLPTFVQKHRKLRNVYHRHALLHLAAKTSLL